MSKPFYFTIALCFSSILLSGCSGSATADSEKNIQSKPGIINDDPKLKAGRAIEQGANDKAEETNSAMPNDDK